MRLGHGYKVGLLAATLLVAGCGFQLRSYDFESNVDGFALTGQTGGAVAAQLRQGLIQAGVTEKPAAEASMVVELMDERRNRRSVSTAGQARAAEYELDIGVRYRILNTGEEELLAPTWIERSRIFRIDRDNIVGSSGEQAILERELMQDVVGQIIRSMDAVSRPAQP